MKSKYIEQMDLQLKVVFYSPNRNFTKIFNSCIVSKEIPFEMLALHSIG